MGMSDLEERIGNYERRVSPDTTLGGVLGLVAFAACGIVYGVVITSREKPVSQLMETIARLPSGKVSPAVEYAFISRLHSRYDTGQYVQLRQQGNCPDVEFLREYLKPTGKNSWDGVYEQRAQLRNEFDLNPKFKCYKTRR